MSILTFENVNQELGNHTKCVHFWRCTERTGDAELVDAVSGANIPIVITSNGDYAIDSGTASIVSISGGSLVDLSSDDWVLFFSGKIATALLLGSGAGAYIRMDDTSSFGTGYEVRGAAGTATTLGNVTDGGLYAQALSFDASGNIIPYENQAAKTPEAASVAGAVDLSTGNQAVLSGVTEMYGMALYKFTAGTLPTVNEIKAASAWLDAKWKAGDKDLYPGFSD